MKTEHVVIASVLGTLASVYVVARLFRPVIEQRIANRVQSQVINGLGRIPSVGVLVNDRPIAQLLFSEVSVPVATGVTEGLYLR